MSKISDELAEVAFNEILKFYETFSPENEPLDGDETEDTCKALLKLLDEHFANV